MKTGVFDTGTLTNKERLLAAYAAYNSQESEALLALASEDVDWPEAAPGCTAKPNFGLTGRANGL